jgi:hypothetical protein
MRTVFCILITSLNCLSIAQSWEWVRLFSDGGISYVNKIAVDNNDNVYIASFGHYGSHNGAYHKEFLRKYTKNGDLAWKKELQMVGNTTFILDRKGALYVMGNNKLEKYSVDGELLWSKTKNIQGAFYSIVLDSKDNVLLSGQARLHDTSGSFFSRYSNGGQLEFEKWGPPLLYAASLEFELNGLIYSNCSGLLQKYDRDGNFITRHRLLDEIVNMKRDAEGNYFLYGHKEGNNLLQKYDSSDELLWEKVIPYTVLGIDVTHAGDVMLVAPEDDALNECAKLLILKYDRNGEQSGRLSNNCSAGSKYYARTIAIGESGNLYHCGALDGAQQFGPYILNNDRGYYDLVVGKISGGILLPMPGKVETINDLKVFPNPSGRIFTVVCPATEGDVHYTVCDGTGRVVYRAAGRGQASSQVIDLSVLPPGLYLLEVRAGGRRYPARLLRE